MAVGHVGRVFPPVPVTVDNRIHVPSIGQLVERVVCVIRLTDSRNLGNMRRGVEDEPVACAPAPSDTQRGAFTLRCIDCVAGTFVPVDLKNFPSPNGRPLRHRILGGRPNRWPIPPSTGLISPSNGVQI